MQISQLLETRRSSQDGEVPGMLTIMSSDANPGMYQETGLNILPRPLREGIASRGYDQHNTTRRKTNRRLYQMERAFFLGETLTHLVATQKGRECKRDFNL